MAKQLKGECDEREKRKRKRKIRMGNDDGE